MNIINGIAREVSPCVRVPPSLAAEERMLWESTYESGVRRMHENVLSWWEEFGG